MSNENNIPKPPVPPPKDKERVAPLPREKEIVYLDNNIKIQPPNAADLEEIVLGTFLGDSKSGEYINLLESEIFFKEAHQHVFRAIKELHSQGSPVDLVTVAEELRRVGKIDLVGGDFPLVQMINQVTSSAHLEFHIRILAQKYVLRELIKMSRATMFQSTNNDPDIFRLMENIENELARIKNIGVRKKVEDVARTPEEELAEKRENRKKGIPPGYPTGAQEFDEWSGGFPKRELITMAGRPGMGKTSTVIAIILFACIGKRIPMVFFSLEMSYIDLMNRLAAGLTGISFNKIKHGELNDEEFDHVNAAYEKIRESPLVISSTVDHRNVSDKMFTLIRQYAAEGYKEFFIDYVQLMKPARRSGDRRSEISDITGELKSLANELNVPIIQLAQLSREPDKRPGHRPMLSDLKESGSIEQDSDMVIFFLRDAYYEKKVETHTVPPPPGAKSREGVIQWIVAKGRSTGTRDFTLHLDFTKFTFDSASDIPF